MQPQNPVAQGHSITFEQDGKTVVLAERVNFVDGSYSGESDGTNEQPFSTIGAALEDAEISGNNTIFVYEIGSQARVHRAGATGGAYRETVRVASGQTLTSEISDDEGHVYGTANLPLIHPSDEQLAANQRTVDYGCEEATFSTALTLDRNTTLRRMKIQGETKKPNSNSWGPYALLAEPDPANHGGAIRIIDSHFEVGVCVTLGGGGNLDDLELTNNTIIGSIDLYLLDNDTLSQLTIQGNTIEEGGVGIQLAASEVAKITIDKNTISGSIALELVMGYSDGGNNVIKSVHITDNNVKGCEILYEYAEVEETVISNSGEVDINEIHEAWWDTFLIDGKEYEREDDD